MKRVRVIPVLLIQKEGLVKSVRFKNHKYVGDPINAIRIFNEKEVDEIIILDIGATAEKRPPNVQKVKSLAGEAFMPFGYGGGITTIEEIKDLLSSGVEKLIFNNIAFNNPQFVREAAAYVGSQSIVISIDVKKNIWGKYKVFVERGTKNTGMDPVDYARKMEAAGAGELFLASIDRDGTFEGYDMELIKIVCASVNIPVVAAGGAASLDDFSSAVKHGASAVAAGSMFVFQLPHRAALISYPSQEELKERVYSILSN